MRTSTPPVKYRIDSDASSSTFNGSNVFGSERRQNRNSPPPCAAAPPTKSHPKATRDANHKNTARGARPTRLEETIWQRIMQQLPPASKAQIETTGPLQQPKKGAQFPMYRR